MDIALRGLHARRTLLLRLVSYGVALHGVLIIAGTLDEQLVLRGGLRGLRLHTGRWVFDLPLLIGLSLIYLSVYLRRRKRRAWLIAVGLYAVLVGLNLARLVLFPHSLGQPLLFVRSIALPAALILVLIMYESEFTVRSDSRSFALSLRLVAIVMSCALLYGVAGFLLLDRRDFHQEITVFGAVQHTVDQFGLTTSHQLVPYTHRALVFVDSLSVMSVAAIIYALFALFQPIRAHLSDQSVNRARTEYLLKHYPASSEDFFKLWPHDKMYFFNSAQTAGLAYGVHGGVAMVVGDPMGDPEAHAALLVDFEDFCYTNGWAVSFIHTEPKHNDLYKRAGFSLQKIGEEAVLNLDHFDQEARNKKYFRQIRNKFDKQGYTTELLTPPHSSALISRLRIISDEWLDQPGRSERRFMMGYFNADYMQQCAVMVLRDAAGTIQAFMNQIPSYDSKEANFDLLRHTSEALGNSNDFLLMRFIEYARKHGFERLNLGLCPLAGLEKRDADGEQSSVVDSALRFVYANGDRFYSFSGLHRFKSKYEPEWQPRFVVYRGNVAGFGRTMNALNRAMKVSSKSSPSVTHEASSSEATL